ncbi:FAD-binding domain-containing protein [Corynespora cassiicola Philippines]|uniref:FAD-binding domain-containing protein n=1 Tax=Corynespora cassiicola Philippines TaxID=1448308 RepID=A0A2T2N9K4_CORCC|nr:FAD-binding domain-containing protein [Corynespora cassiicola Philippines]
MKKSLTLCALLVSCAYSSISHEKKWAEFKTALSDGANLFLKEDKGFQESIKRWQYWKSPDVQAVVKVRTEEDVQESIRFANRHEIPFFIFTSGHGATQSFETLKNSLQIDLRYLDDIKISPGGSSVTLGGGVKGANVAKYLHGHGKQTVTGVCECVGFVGVALGGGHGVLQGYHGFLTDQILSLRVVTANGTLVTVSPTENTDLWWAMRGAGHNFGIVTSLEYKIYDITEKQWSVEAFTFPATAEIFRKVYTQAKKNMAVQPEGITEGGFITALPMPALNLAIIANMPLAQTQKYTQVYRDLGPLAIHAQEGTLLDVPKMLGVDRTSAVCNREHGMSDIRMPVDIPTYNVEVLAQAMERFVQIATEYPELGQSFVMTEQYPTQGVKKVDERDTAVPGRRHDLLIAPDFVFESLDREGNVNEGMEEFALKMGLEVRQMLVDGAKDMGGAMSYVNYAYGGEDVEEMYGEDWRVEKLRALKKKFDPKGRFGWYNPFVEVNVDTENGGHRSEL